MIRIFCFWWQFSWWVHLRDAYFWNYFRARGWFYHLEHDSGCFIPHEPNLKTIEDSSYWFTFTFSFHYGHETLYMLVVVSDHRASSSILGFEGEIVGVQSFPWRMTWRLGISFLHLKIPLGWLTDPTWHIMDSYLARATWRRGLQLICSSVGRATWRLGISFLLGATILCLHVATLICHLWLMFPLARTYMWPWPPIDLFFCICVRILRDKTLHAKFVVYSTS